jgi:hypothetical protein
MIAPPVGGPYSFRLFLSLENVRDLCDIPVFLAFDLEVLAGMIIDSQPYRMPVLQDLSLTRPIVTSTPHTSQTSQLRDNAVLR